MKPWKRIDPTKVIKGQWRKITFKSFELPDGSTTAFEVYDTDGREHANIIALTPDHKVVIAEQYRPGPEKIMFELPGGTVDDGEEPEAAVVRELLEETCYKPGKVKKLGAYYKDAYMNATWHSFIAYDCELTTVSQATDEDEYVQVRLISIDELIQNAKTGLMTDAQSVLMTLEQLQALK
jgi:ADP-ribose pyrophosphatase